jgi:uncharacterized phage protein (TIGR01671 family)
MSRTIKFRALKDDVSNCNFVYGSLIYSAEGEPRITEDFGASYHTCIKGTEGQFTGILDKNGNKIYEGDIIYAEFDGENILGNVYCNEITFDIDCEYDPECNMLLFLKANDIGEVIGNIYENADLLK